MGNGEQAIVKPSIIAVVGATGVGKSATAVEIALEVQGEIISADSQQVYRGMDVGTGKPGPEARARVRHHLIDRVGPDGEYNAAIFRQWALDAEREIRGRGRKTILCGGTGLYIKAFLYGLFTGPAKSLEFRAALEEEIKEKGIGALYGRLKKADGEAAGSIHPHDRLRIIRALEVLSQTGRKISEWQEEHGFKESPFEVLKIGLKRDREELYSLIDRRCDAMMAGGLVDEVKGLLARGYSWNLKPMQSLGYRHVGLYLRGEMTFDGALDLMKRDTRRLAKRQLTWFRSDPEIGWFHPDRECEAILESAKCFLSAPLNR